jgi:hypothetical protein
VRGGRLCGFPAVAFCISWNRIRGTQRSLERLDSYADTRDPYLCSTLDGIHRLLLAQKQAAALDGLSAGPGRAVGGDTYRAGGSSLADGTCLCAHGAHVPGNRAGSLARGDKTRQERFSRAQGAHPDRVGLGLVSC